MTSLDQTTQTSATLPQPQQLSLRGLNLEQTIEPSGIFNARWRSAPENLKTVVSTFTITKPEQLNGHFPGRTTTVREDILNIYFATMADVYNENPDAPVMVKELKDVGKLPSVTISAEQALDKAYNLFLNGKGLIVVALDENNSPIGITAGGEIPRATANAMFKDAYTEEIVLNRLAEHTEKPVYLAFFAGIKVVSQGLIIESDTKNETGVNSEKIKGKSLYELFWNVRLENASEGSLILTRTANDKVKGMAEKLGFTNFSSLTFTVPTVKTVDVLYAIKGSSSIA